MDGTLYKLLAASWSGFADSGGLHHYELCYGSSPGGADVFPCAPLGLQTRAAALLADDFTIETYYATVVAVDRAGRRTNSSSPGSRVFQLPQPSAVFAIEALLDNRSSPLRFTSNCGASAVRYTSFRVDSQCPVAHSWSLCDVHSSCSPDAVAVPDGVWSPHTPQVREEQPLSPLHTAHCTLHTAHLLHTVCCSLLTAHCSLLTAHYSLLTTHCSLLTAHYSLPTTQYSLPTTHYSLLFTHHSLPTTHCSLLTAHSSLLAAHYSPLTTYYLPLTTHYSPFTTHNSLLTTHY